MTRHTAKQFSVDAVGAYVTELYDVAGRPILFPRTRLGEKLRGGSHVCYPYFGPDRAGLLPQHGFGRTVAWQVEVSADERTVMCRYDEAQHELFAGLSAQLRYHLNATGDELATELTVTNHSDQPRAVMPGFHPYMAVDPADVRLNGKQIDVADFEPFRSFPDSAKMTLETAGRTVTVSSGDLTHMIVWTDAQDNYLCVEPTARGNGFDASATPHDVLQPGGVVEYRFSIAWS